ncbi:methylenetetrahydrofolate reductase (NADPH) [Parabacteroides sp. PF5-5]|uniref:methylenetetrahydrofolate reductase n=1 Tax=unclassified Parabacteroides TaxID=2649774 RepID=UPI002476ED27|nr:MULTISPECIES: methylenetetrahydrofolate reductase [unclassified Parabacteroides]MDH6306948.1 methylenetetrahydrofolate reductase (NADPH) [Parabacteroides sp. PH5-39]MDH6317791.1 methylenetetrahydrofolate reductase (NADPH) [Parabacteroides sp. PF5-13]MDH6321553.1 methylenetetrahydrofolate reductase (NADPH) [Parabacteroides sp. PH5-13]MDH6325335.1 methylenetetrahydrofolate reductase (NADPH) [Parabacteroides sp. PH5-8]MDH6329006.1 methylenetetrahydrofolate reductase (NADPH) [Parabacteroides sp
MRVIDHIRNSKQTAFSFEILPPLKGNSVQKVYSVIDKLREFDPKYINITSHHSEFIYKTLADGSYQRVNIRKRPGSVAIASAIQNKYGIIAVPHIICKGFSKDETEYALIDLNFLGVYDLLLLRGDVKTLDPNLDKSQFHDYAIELQEQVNNFNKGIAVDGSTFEANETPFSYGMACYPEKHEEAPNIESDIYYAKKKVENGADYLVTQMFFDNEKYYTFVDRCRAEGITVPIIPGVKPIVFKNQLTILPKVFRSDIPEALAKELRKCKTDEDAKAVGVEWCTMQCKDLMVHQVPSLHFYSFMATESVYQVAKEVY